MHVCPIDPEDFVLSLFEYGKASGEEAWAIQLHWLRGCPACLQAILDRAGLSSFEELAALATPTIELPTLYGRQEVSPLIDALEGLSPSDQARMIETDGRLHCVAALSEILERCRTCWGSAAQEALTLSNLALALVDWVVESDAKTFFAGELPDLRVRAWAYQGNSYRLLGNLHRAELSFAQAVHHLDSCWLDDRAEAEVLRLKAGLQCVQGSYSAARLTITRSIELYNEGDDYQSLGRALMVGTMARYACKDFSGMDRDLHQALAW